MAIAITSLLFFRLEATSTSYFVKPSAKPSVSFLGALFKNSPKFFKPSNLGKHGVEDKVEIGVETVGVQSGNGVNQPGYA